MATALAALAMAGGTALSAYSTIQGGKEAAETGKIQQQQLENEAKSEQLAGLDESGLKRKEGRALTASQIAAISASGGGMVGSNLVLMAESAKNVEMDASIISRNADLRAKSLKQQGAWARYEGQLARRNARMRAFANVAQSAGQAYLMFRKPKGDGEGNGKGGDGSNVNIGGSSFGNSMAVYGRPG